MVTKFGTNVSNERLLNAAKSQGYRFYSFLVITVSLQWRVGGDIKRVLLLVISPPMKLINRDNNNI